MKTIGICASGPSLTREDCQTLKVSDVIIAVNDSWRMVDCNILYAADQHWWSHHINDINIGFTGRRVSCDPLKDGKRSNSNWNNSDPIEWGVEILGCEIGERGLSRNKERVHSGGNSGYQAINLAYHLLGEVGGRVILLGYDMHNHSGKSHWFGDHPTTFVNNSKPDRFIDAFRSIKPDDYGLEIINCSRVTALDAFPVRKLEDVI